MDQLQAKFEKLSNKASKKELVESISSTLWCYKQVDELKALLEKASPDLLNQLAGFLDEYGIHPTENAMDEEAIDDDGSEGSDGEVDAKITKPAVAEKKGNGKFDISKSQFDEATTNSIVNVLKSASSNIPAVNEAEKQQMENEHKWKEFKEVSEFLNEAEESYSNYMERLQFREIVSRDVGGHC